MDVRGTGASNQVYPPTQKLSEAKKEKEENLPVSDSLEKLIGKVGELQVEILPRSGQAEENKAKPEPAPLPPPSTPSTIIKSATTPKQRSIPLTITKIKEAGEFLAILAKQTGEAVAHFLESSVNFFLKLRKKPDAQKETPPIVHKATIMQSKEAMQPKEVQPEEPPSPKVAALAQKSTAPTERKQGAQQIVEEPKISFKESVFDKTTDLQAVFLKIGKDAKLSAENINDLKTKLGNLFEDLKKFIQAVKKEKENGKSIEDTLSKNSKLKTFLDINFMQDLLPSKEPVTKADAEKYRAKTVELLIDHYDEVFGK